MDCADKLVRAKKEKKQAARLMRAIHLLITRDAGQIEPFCFGCKANAADLSEPLEINHLYGKPYISRERNAYRRALAYWREYWNGIEAGLPELDLRCPDCNKRYRPAPRPDPGQELPF